MICVESDHPRGSGVSGHQWWPQCPGQVIVRDTLASASAGVVMWENGKTGWCHISTPAPMLEQNTDLLGNIFVSLP